MKIKTAFKLSAAGLVAVIAQPVFGWDTIPAFFHYSTGAAIGLGALDVLLILWPLGVIIWQEIGDERALQ